MLDVPSITFLSTYLQSYPSTVLVVSHDRAFLNEVATDIIHQHSERLDYYKGADFGMYFPRRYYLWKCSAVTSVVPKNNPGVLIFADSLQIPSTPLKKNAAKPQNANTTTRWSNVPICKPSSTNSATTPPNPPKPNLVLRNSRKCRS